eukprot:1317544-Amorphochlora_amoeboformis.AAC.1
MALQSRSQESGISPLEDEIIYGKIAMVRFFFPPNPSLLRSLGTRSEKGKGSEVNSTRTEMMNATNKVLMFASEQKHPRALVNISSKMIE